MTRVNIVTGSASRVVCGARSRRASGSHHRLAGTEARAAEAVGTAAVVDGARSVRGVHALRSPLQRIQRTGGRASLHAA